MNPPRRLKCCTCDLWIELETIRGYTVTDADFERMKRIGVKCGDCVTAAIIDEEEGDWA
jgi:hypothetical protein